MSAVDDSGCASAAEQDAVARMRRVARRILDAARGSHGWDHTLRVVGLCERMGPIEGADMTVLRIAAYLHDIGRRRQDEGGGTLCHAAQGARMAARLLGPLPLSPERRGNVVHCIRSHRYRAAPAPATLEARILFDADKLDAIGAVGVARAFLFAGELGARLHCPGVPPDQSRPYGPEDTGYREYMVKLRFVHQCMLTATGRRLAAVRHEFMAGFFERFLQEIEGF
jgi:uncharacterized protein